MKIARLIILLGFVPSLVLADAETASMVEKVTGVFVRLDAEWRVVGASTNSPSDLKRYEIELQKAAEKFFEIANAHRKTNPVLSEAAGLVGNLVVDSAYVIFTGGEKKQTGVVILKAHAQKIAILPHVYLGVLTSLAPSKTRLEGFLTQKEIGALRQSLAKEFGDKIIGPKSINGDNAFAQAGSLTDGFLKALQR